MDVFNYLKSRFIAVIMDYTNIYRKIVENDPKKAIDLMWLRCYKKHFPWDNPVTLNEKINWLSAMTDTSKWTEYSDKYEVRKYVESIGLGHILTKCYGVWDNVDDINFETLPSSFVIKCTHDCGSTILVHDKTKIDVPKIKNFLLNHQKKVLGYTTCEPHYVKIKPRIMAEELLVSEEKQEAFYSKSLVDYKIWCINSKAAWAFVCYDRHLDSEGKDPNGHSTVFDLYDLNTWKPMRQYLTEEYKHVTFKDVPRPENLNEMVEVAERLAHCFPQVRIDLYDVKGKIYFGEMTFTSQGGRMGYYTDEFQRITGNLINLDLNRN